MLSEFIVLCLRITVKKIPVAKFDVVHGFVTLSICFPGFFNRFVITASRVNFIL